MPFCQAAYCRIATHLSDAVQITRQQERFDAQFGTDGRRFTASMAAADYNDAIISPPIIHFMRNNDVFREMASAFPDSFWRIRAVFGEQNLAIQRVLLLKCSIYQVKFPHRTLFFLLISLLIFLLAGSVSIYIFGAKLLRQLGIEYQLTGETSSRFLVENLQFDFKKVRGNAQTLSIPKPLYAISEWLLQKPIAGGIRVENLHLELPTFWENEMAAEEDFEALSGAVLLQLGQVLQSPIFSFPEIFIGRVQVSEVPLALENVQLRGGVFFFDLVARDRPVLQLEVDIGTLRTSVKDLAKRLRSSSRGLSGSGSRRFLARLNGRLQFNQFPVSLLGNLLPKYVKPQGIVDGRLQIVNGQWDGRFSLKNLQTWPLPLIGSFHEIGGVFFLRPDGVLIENLQAESSGRRLQLWGRIEGITSGKLKYDLYLRGNDLPLVKSGGLNLRADVDLSLQTLRNRTGLAGKIQMRRSLWFSDAVDFAADWRALYNGSGSKKTLPWDLDLNIQGERFLRINTPYFRGMLSAQLDIGGNLTLPVIYGQIFANHGVILFPFARFQLNEGRITFDPSRAPQLDVEAKSRLFGYDLRLLANGSPTVPQITFFSSPGLSGGEILTMITTGRSPAIHSSGVSGLNQVSALGIYFGSGLFGDDFSDRVRIQIGQDVTESGSETMQVEYKINDRQSLIGEYDRFDNYNADFKMKIYSR